MTAGPTSAHPTTHRRPSAAPGATTPHAQSLRLAAIDVGSNSIHMIVAQADADGGVTTLWRMKEMVGLGRMSFPSHRLSRDAMDRAIHTLARFKQAAMLRQAEKVVAVATSAVREAVNGGDFIRRAKREVGLYVRVVPAREEARLIYLAVRHAMHLGDKPHLIVDVGGGSVEFIVADARKTALLESRKLGAARMTARYVHSDPISKPDRDALLRHYDRELKPLVASITALNPVRVIGTSGTLENLADMCGTGGGSGTGADGNGADGPAVTGVIERKRLEKLVDALLDSRSKDRARMRGLDDQRKDQVTAGALLVRELFRRLDLKRIDLCGSALREGILLDYLARHIPDVQIRSEVPDPRRRSVIDLGRRSHWDQPHAQHVAGLTVRLFDELRPLHGMGSAERELIEYAALLHDVGLHIARPAHHKHSAYLIRNGKLRDFADEEVEVIAAVARYHRKALPSPRHPAYAALSRRARRVVDVGTALLRAADGLDRSHAQVVTGVRCRIGDKRVRCAVTARSDAELELWAARRRADGFPAAFNRQIDFALAPTR